MSKQIEVSDSTHQTLTELAAAMQADPSPDDVIVELFAAARTNLDGVQMDTSLVGEQYVTEMD